MILILSNLISCSPVAATDEDEEDGTVDGTVTGEVEVLTGVLGIFARRLVGQSNPLRKACVL